MKERYWNAHKLPPNMEETLLDWLSENVALAVEELWGESHVSWINDPSDYGGRMVLEVSGPPKATKSDPSGQMEFHTQTVDVLREIDVWAEDGLSDDQIESLRTFAQEVLKICDKFDGA